MLNSVSNSLCLSSFNVCFYQDHAEQVSLFARQLIQRYFQQDETSQLHHEVVSALINFHPFNYMHWRNITRFVMRLLQLPLKDRWMDEKSLLLIMCAMHKLQRQRELGRCLATLLRIVEHDESDYGTLVVTSLEFLCHFEHDSLVWQSFEEVLQCICSYHEEWKEKYHEGKLTYLYRMRELVRRLSLMTQEEREQLRYMQMTDFILQALPVGVDEETKQYALNLIGRNQLTLSEVVSCAKRCEDCIDHVRDHLDAWQCLLSIEHNISTHWKSNVGMSQVARIPLNRTFNMRRPNDIEPRVIRNVIDRVAQMLQEQKWYDFGVFFVDHIDPAPEADIKRSILFAMPSKTFAHASWGNIEEVVEFVRAFDPYQYKRIFDCLGAVFSKKNLQEDRYNVRRLLCRIQDLCRYHTDAGNVRFDIERVALTICSSRYVWKYLEVCKERQIVHIMKNILPELVIKDLISYLNFFVPIDKKHEIFNRVRSMIERKTQKRVSGAIVKDADRFAEYILRIKRNRDENIETFANKSRLTSRLQQQLNISGCKRKNCK